MAGCVSFAHRHSRECILEHGSKPLSSIPNSGMLVAKVSLKPTFTFYSVYYAQRQKKINFKMIICFQIAELLLEFMANLIAKVGYFHKIKLSEQWRTCHVAPKKQGKLPQIWVLNIFACRGSLEELNTQLKFPGPQFPILAFQLASFTK